MTVTLLLSFCSRIFVINHLSPNLIILRPSPIELWQFQSERLGQVTCTVLVTAVGSQSIVMNKTRWLNTKTRKHYSTGRLNTRISAVADKPHDVFVQWYGLAYPLETQTSSRGLSCRKFDCCWSNSTSVCMEIRCKIGPCVPPFKVTHWRSLELTQIELHGTSY